MLFIIIPSLVLFIVLIFLLIIALKIRKSKMPLKIYFEGLSAETVYCTLLTKEPKCGKYATPDKNTDVETLSDRTDEYFVFYNYKDKDDFYFIQNIFELNILGKKSIEWKVKPPKHFKILLYYPERRIYLSSTILNKCDYKKSSMKVVLKNDTITISNL